MPANTSTVKVEKMDEPCTAVLCPNPGKDFSCMDCAACYCSESCREADIGRHNCVDEDIGLFSSFRGYSSFEKTLGNYAEALLELVTAGEINYNNISQPLNEQNYATRAKAFTREASAIEAAAKRIDAVFDMVNSIRVAGQGKQAFADRALPLKSALWDVQTDTRSHALDKSALSDTYVNHFLEQLYQFVGQSVGSNRIVASLISFLFNTNPASRNESRGSVIKAFRDVGKDVDVQFAKIFKRKK